MVRPLDYCHVKPPYIGGTTNFPEEALHLVDQSTLLIIVDTHKPTMVIEPRLIDRCDRVVVIDHHRRGEEFVSDPVLVYLEPYASSTSELVTELLQYQKERLSLDPLEATALFAGIAVDLPNGFPYGQDLEPLKRQPSCEIRVLIWHWWSRCWR